MIKCRSFEFGRENGQHSVMTHRDRCTRSVRHDLEPNIFLSGPTTQSISTYLHINLSLKKIKKKIWVNCIFATKLIRIGGYGGFASLPVRPYSLCRLAPTCAWSPPNLRTRFLKAEHIPFLRQSHAWQKHTRYFETLGSTLHGCKYQTKK